jgi:hypothetical protein
MRRLVPRGARIITIVLPLAAACGFAIAVVGLPWWSMPEVTIGPMSSAKCFGGECSRAGLEWVGSGSWIRFGVATWGAGLIATACLIGLGAAMAAKRAGALIAKMVIAAGLAATAAAGAFVGTFPGVPGMSMSIGVYVYFGAVLVAVTAAVMTLRRARAAVPA